MLNGEYKINGLLSRASLFCLCSNIPARSAGALDCGWSICGITLGNPDSGLATISVMFRSNTKNQVRAPRDTHPMCGRLFRSSSPHRNDRKYKDVGSMINRQIIPSSPSLLKGGLSGWWSVFPRKRDLCNTMTTSPVGSTGCSAASATVAPTSFILPDLFSHCPFPLIYHPNGDAIAQESVDWLDTSCPDLSPKQRKALHGLKAGELTGYCYPTTSPERLRVVSDFMNYLFHL